MIREISWKMSASKVYYVLLAINHGVLSFTLKVGDDLDVLRSEASS